MAIIFFTQRDFTTSTLITTNFCESFSVVVESLKKIETADQDHAKFVTECGKGTYVRALARDLGRLLGCLGHVAALRRTVVGPFDEDVGVSLDALQRPRPDETAAAELAALLPVEAGLAALPALRVSTSDAGLPTRAQAVLLRGRDTAVMAGCVGVSSHVALTALSELVKE